MQGFQVGKEEAVVNTRWNLNTGIVQLQSKASGRRCACARVSWGLLNAWWGGLVGGGHAIDKRVHEYS